MDQNLVAIIKRIRRIVRAVLFTVRRGLSKTQLILELNTIMKRSKIAGKALANLMFHHHSSSLEDLREYEFSCSNSPAYLPFHLTKRRRHTYRARSENSFTYDDVLPTPDGYDVTLVEASPMLPGFGRTPIVRPLRVTDSPFPLQNVGGDSQIDKDAEEFINKFYNQLKQQKKRG